MSLAEFGHGHEILQHGHASKLWLPYLWGFHWEEFAAYLEACQRATRLHEEERWEDFEAEVASLWGSVFTWTRNRTLEGNFRAYLSARLKEKPVPGVDVDDVIGKVKVLLHTIVADACLVYAVENQVKCLHPDAAMRRAIEYVLEEEPRNSR